MRLDILRAIGHDMLIGLHANMDANYDCNCLYCRSTVIFFLYRASASGNDIDEIEVSIRDTVKHLLAFRRELRRAAVLAEANDAMGSPPTDTLQ